MKKKGIVFWWKRCGLVEEKGKKISVCMESGVENTTKWIPHSESYLSLHVSQLCLTMSNMQATQPVKKKADLPNGFWGSIQWPDSWILGLCCQSSTERDPWNNCLGSAKANIFYSWDLFSCVSLGDRMLLMSMLRQHGTDVDILHE